MGAKLLTAFLFAAATACSLQAAVTKADLEAAAKDLEADAERWIASQDAEEKPAAKPPAAVQYDLQSFQALTEVLAYHRKPIVDMYVARGLLEPLMSADPQTLLKFMPLVKRTEARWKYLPPPGASRRGLEYPSGQNMPSAQAIMAISKIRQQREEKAAKEISAYLHNKAYDRLKIVTMKLALLAGDGQDDRSFARSVAVSEQQKSAMYAKALDSLASVAPRLSPERAKFFYGQLMPLRARLLNARGEYLDPGHIMIDPSGASQYSKAHDWPGIRISQTINALAVVAKEPAVTVPQRGASADDDDDEHERAKPSKDKPAPKPKPAPKRK